MAGPARFIGELPARSRLRDAICDAARLGETEAVAALLRRARLPAEKRRLIDRHARRLVRETRRLSFESGGLDAFLGEYALSSQEGLVLMCLAESLLRIPDADTADRLIRDKLGSADWKRHLGHSQSVFVNASTLGLMLTGGVIALDSDTHDIGGYLGRLVARTGEPVIRRALVQAMRILGRQFVMARTIEEALDRASGPDYGTDLYSFDMLGEAAHTAADAERYLGAYGHAIDALSRAAQEGGTGGDIARAPEISVKLSALHPRFEYAQRARVMDELVPRLAGLAAQARKGGIGLTVDAEEADRLDVSLDAFEAVFASTPDGWDGLGLAVQAYQIRAPMVIDWLARLARTHRRRIPVRLVKGAYWDSEIKHAQQLGLDGYKVFTRKASTDLSYIVCVRRLFAGGARFLPRFATHNAHTVAAVRALAPKGADYEFQRLHGMGQTLYQALAEQHGGRAGGMRCRVYAPVGSHEDLLPYLVRRLLENGANSSFVNRLADIDAPVADIVADPVAQTASLKIKPHPRIPLPVDIYGPGRKGARGIDLTDPQDFVRLQRGLATAARKGWQSGPVIGGKLRRGRLLSLYDPADRRRTVGRWSPAAKAHIDAALGNAVKAAPGWDALGGDRRADCLAAAAEAMESGMAPLIAILVREAGKTIADAVAEVREAVDYCRYYGELARRDFEAPETLPGPTGELNQLSLHGRGVIACISPWNFPLAIFIGQVAAALAAGNAVVAKPAEQTPLVAAQAVRLLHRAGVPGDVLHLLPGDGRVGAALIADPRVGGVVFTGSTETARAINQVLAARDGPIVPLVAETGGQNAMIVDSSALPEQVVRDVIASAFLSAGQRCSALRVLFLQSDGAGRILDMLTGAMAELAIGDPGLLATDVGPVIDTQARDMLQTHGRRMARAGKLLYRCILPDATAHGTFFAPAAFEIDRLTRLQGEVFGPILHVIRWQANRLDQVIDAVNATGFGLTAGVHSRIEETIRHVAKRLHAGNAYVNRNMVGAVVGTQPFGGEGLSGTGPKAGGPRYLHRLAVERTLSTDTTAMGGNASLLTLEEEVED